MTDIGIIGAVLGSGDGNGGDWLERALAPLIDAAEAARTGVYTSTPDAGGAVAVAFWRRALAETVALASPADFPRTLASGIGTKIAMTYGLRGPNVTLVGGHEASEGALDEATWHLRRGAVARAIVARIEAGVPGRSACVHALLLGSAPDGGPWDIAPGGEDPIVRAAISWVTRQGRGPT